MSVRSTGTEARAMLRILVGFKIQCTWSFMMTHTYNTYFFPLWKRKLDNTISFAESDRVNLSTVLKVMKYILPGSSK